MCSALKLLPKEFTEEPERVRRFELEARAASSLNHPNIVTILEVGQVEGRHFIAIEYIEGQTLRQRLTSSAMALSQALDVAMQVASALSAAHEAGILHRDIKPENVMLRRDGYVKVLDFGLAKLTEQQAAAADSEARTVGQVSTDAGVVMGTVTYMSPEQARGLAVDERTDIFSLGIVLYEMVAGRAPFEGKTPSDTIAAILGKTPLPLVRYQQEAPEQVQWVVNKALRKEREERYQSAKEMLSDLREVKQELELKSKLERSASPGMGGADTVVQFARASDEQVTVDTADKPAVQSKPLPRLHISRIFRYKKIAILALAVMIAGAGGISLWQRIRSEVQSDKKPVAAFQNIEITKLTNTGNASWPAISSDGKYIAYVSRDVAGKSIWLKHLDTGSIHQILAPVRVRHLAQLTFSPDGSYIYFAKSVKFGPLQELFRLPVLGGVPPTKIITDLGYYTLSPDGARIAFVRNSRATGESALMIANADGTAEYRLAARKLSDGYGAIAWSPDGKVIACSVGSTAVSGERMYPVEVRVADGAERVLTSERWVYLGIMLWLADGSGLLATGFFQGTISGIWHISYPGGEVRRLTDDANTAGGFGLTADSKTLVGQTLALQTNIWTAPIGDEVQSPAALAKQLTTGADNYQVCGWMPDGRILFTSSADNPLGYSIRVMNADGSGQKQLTANAEASESPVYSPDGRYIVFVSNRAGRLNIWRMDGDGDNPKQLTFGNNEKAPTCSPDGKWVVYTAGDDSTLWKVPMEGGEAERLTDSYWRYAIFSPDGKWLAAFHRGPQPDAPFKIGILPFTGGAPIKLFEPSPNTSFTGAVRWTRDGQALIYVGTRDGVTNLWRQPLDGGKLTQLTDFKAADEIYGFDLSPDGKQIVFARGAWAFDIVLIRNFR